MLEALSSLSTTARRNYSQRFGRAMGRNAYIPEFHITDHEKKAEAQCLMKIDLSCKRQCSLAATHLPTLFMCSPHTCSNPRAVAVGDSPHSEHLCAF